MHRDLQTNRILFIGYVQMIIEFISYFSCLILVHSFKQSSEISLIQELLQSTMIWFICFEVFTITLDGTTIYMVLK